MCHFSSLHSSHVLRCRLSLLLLLLPGHGHGDLIAADEEDDAQFAIVFAAMGVNMETAHFFKQVNLRARR
jgi:hypothetical protein